MFAKRLDVRILLLVVMVFGLAACGSPTPVVGPTQTIADAATAYPYPEPATPDRSYQHTPPYPLPTSAAGNNEFPPVVIPSPASDKGVVTGIMINEETGQPLVGETVYLATIIYLTPQPGIQVPEGGLYNIAIQEVSSPHATTDGAGRFAIGDVAPGNYILMVWTPFNATFVMSTENPDRERIISVTAGETLDLGPVEVLDPMVIPPTPAP